MSPRCPWSSHGSVARPAVWGCSHSVRCAPGHSGSWGWGRGSVGASTGPPYRDPCIKFIWTRSPCLRTQRREGSRGITLQARPLGGGAAPCRPAQPQHPALSQACFRQDPGRWSCRRRGGMGQTNSSVRDFGCESEQLWHRLQRSLACPLDVELDRLGAAWPSGLFA